MIYYIYINDFTHERSTMLTNEGGPQGCDAYLASIPFLAYYSELYKAMSLILFSYIFKSQTKLYTIKPRGLLYVK